MRKTYFQAGLDESGRGPLAGPVVACAVLLKSDFNGLLKSDFSGIRDSKKLSAGQREKFYNILTNHPRIEWGIGRVSEKMIDKINILQATKLAMKKAVRKLRREPDSLILDGNFKINLAIPQKSVVKADEKIFSCMAAGIIAKVTRDRIMQRYHKKYPQYGFDKHKGYPTKEHIRMLNKYGECDIYRSSFRYGCSQTKKNQIAPKSKKNASSS